ncbi:hypothetical protein H6F75_22430 [Nodosilinea sp. FACHB-131]|uniref:hypothetical protein n=1 Tax=Cyanophyceae TaxID=3028117 RepID=UPI001684E2AC|nr:hypothetical protein [Nodosilinea sp. FACHB-131]MBD1876247.1 hypothetical protein [Nodosilinea sp. FACHB-131]
MTEREIRLRRTLGSGPPADLAFGEAAYSEEDETIYVGRANEEDPPAAFKGQLNSETVSQADLDLKAPLIVTQGTAAYGATVNLNMATLAGTHQTISLTGNIAFTSSNRGTGRQVVIRLLCDATQRTLSFPADWRFLGSKPANIAALKVGVLSLTFFGENDSDGIAAWGVES